jgi:hypothetical protein
VGKGVCGLRTFVRYFLNCIFLSFGHVVCLLIHAVDVVLKSESSARSPPYEPSATFVSAGPGIVQPQPPAATAKNLPATPPPPPQLQKIETKKCDRILILIMDGAKSLNLPECKVATIAVGKVSEQPMMMSLRVAGLVVVAAIAGADAQTMPTTCPTLSNGSFVYQLCGANLPGCPTGCVLTCLWHSPLSLCSIIARTRNDTNTNNNPSPTLPYAGDAMCFLLLFACGYCLAFRARGHCPCAPLRTARSHQLHTQPPSLSRAGPYLEYRGPITGHHTACSPPSACVYRSY